MTERLDSSDFDSEERGDSRMRDEDSHQSNSVIWPEGIPIDSSKGLLAVVISHPRKVSRHTFCLTRKSRTIKTHQEERNTSRPETAHSIPSDCSHPNDHNYEPIQSNTLSSHPANEPRTSERETH